MKKNNTIKQLMVSHAIELFPNSIKQELLSDTELVKKLSVKTDSIIRLNNGEISFSRENIFNAIRYVFNNNKEIFYVDDIEDNTWQIKFHPNDIPSFLLRRRDVEFTDDSFWLLHPDVMKRIEIYKNEVINKKISFRDYEFWIDKISSESMCDDDVVDVLINLELSPKYMELLLRREFESHKLLVMVPDDEIYYERLVGRYQDSKNILEYSNNELMKFFEERLIVDVCEDDLLVCFHNSLSKGASKKINDYEKFNEIARIAINTCHPILLISCIEIGMFNFRNKSHEILRNLFECISSAKTKENLYLLCSLMIYTDGELAKLQVFINKPPFYRRLAAFAHASLIAKVIIDEDISYGNIKQWANEQRRLYFLCQTLLDLVNEPRWLPNYLTEEQLENELYGRIAVLCENFSQNETCDYFQSELQTGAKLKLYSFLPGPLEGNLPPPIIPEDISFLLNQHFKIEPSLNSYRVLVNSAPFWNIDNKYIEQILSLLENAQHKLEEANDKDSVYQVLVGLAQVSCMTKNEKLASSVMTLSRMYRSYLDVESEPENFLAIGIVAAAAFENKDDWAEYIGKWSTEISYVLIAKENMARVLLMLEKICIMEPYLYHTCSKALDILKVLSIK
ncbi:TPA: hypothetical protein ACOWQJ_001270 [Providencia rettgeri]